jgi:hypothetical protein
MMRLAVHCCCEPAIRLGTVPVPDDFIQHRRAIRFAIPPRSRLVARDGVIEPEQTLPGMEIWTEVAELQLSDGTIYYAVKSAHQPLEVWQRVPGFIADRGLV